MGGEGELVNYLRLRAKTKKERESIKQEIIDLIDQASTAISVIALVEEPPKLRKGAAKRKVKGKARRKK
jgi:hypothetical protein